MFFLTYLRRELRRRMRQAIFIALGLAIGIGLVITVIGASSGVKAAQAKVLRALYGIGTDVTVTTKPKPRSERPLTGQANAAGPGGGTDISHPHLGPLSNGKLASGRTFTAADANADVAVVDANYATANKLKVGSTVTVAKTTFTVIGIVTQPQASSPPEVYIPLARAQALATNPATGKSMKNMVNTVYVTAASAADIGAVQAEIEHLLPQATVTSSSDLASEITGSAASAAKLAGALGKWLAVLVLIAAFAVASLLTMAAVARRVPEFGTLKALGWRSSRIVSQVLGESVSTGIIGGLAGVGLGFAGVAIIDKIAPKLSATVPSASGSGGLQTQVGGSGVGGGPTAVGPAASHAATIAVPMSASVTVGAIILAVLLAIAGGLLAGSFGGWRAARLRPAAALARVA